MKPEKTHGGKREGAGPKTIPGSDHKKNVVVYIEQKHINELGGQMILKSKIRKFVYGLVGIPYIDDKK